MRPWQQPVRAEQRIGIEPDGTIVARSGKVEYGQCIRTGFAHIVAEELSVAVDRVRVVLGETDTVPWDMGTFGSMSTAIDGAALRKAAAFVRERLLDRAVEKLGVARERLQCKGGFVHADSGAAVSFADLVAGDTIAGEVADDVKLAPRVAPEDRPERAEAVAIVTGAARYGADVRLPGMLRGHALEAPRYGARLGSLDDSAARAIPGVHAVVRDGDFVGVVADRAAIARKAVRALRAEWLDPITPPGAVELSLREDEGFDASWDGTSRRLSARFTTPHIAHASIGPSAAVAEIRADGAHLYTATQRPFPLRDDAAKILGVPKEQVHVHPQFSSSTYGRNAGADAALEALRLARAVGKPVLVEWTRGEEFRRSPNRPEVTAEIAGALDADGSIAAWRYEEWTQPHTYGGSEMPRELLVATSGRNAIPLYRTRMRAKLHIEPASVRTGAFRSLAAAPNVFAIESFMDELAALAGADAIEFRLRHLDDARMRRVLEAVRDRSGWRTRAKGPGHGRGVGIAVYHGSYVAEVAYVAVDPSGAVQLERVHCVVDPGRLVHPDGARNQAEGGIVLAASCALMERLEHDDGRVRTSSFAEYPIARMRDVPREIDVHLAPDPAAPSTGMGETCFVPLAAAIANAIHDACGARVRTLPLTRDAVRAAVSSS